MELVRIMISLYMYIQITCTCNKCINIGRGKGIYRKDPKKKDHGSEYRAKVSCYKLINLKGYNRNNLHNYSGLV